MKTMSFVDGEEYDCSVCGKRVAQGERSVHVDYTDEWVCSQDCAEQSVMRYDETDVATEAR